MDAEWCYSTASLATRLNHRGSSTGLPEMLTVEEAARFMRIGRTKAYAMAREWRDSGGRSGLPTVDLGHVLRVPRWRLEQMLSAGLGEPDVEAEHLVRLGDVPAESTADARSDGGCHHPETDRQERLMGRKQDRTNATPKQQVPASPRSRQRHTRPASQLDLFDATPGPVPEA